MFEYTRTLALAALFGCGALTVGASPARAQCSFGAYLGPCASDIGYAGCCPNANSLQWCEDDLLCGFDCSGNPGHEGCCAASSFAGCEDPGIEACVCSIDDWCCDSLWGWDEFCVQIATVDCGACEAGGRPPVYCGWLDGEGFYDCREDPSADPSGASPRACGPSCDPSCAGKQCGKNACGDSCGSCGNGATCSAAGQCIAPCVPQCAGKQCGADGCGGSCGQCTSVQTCSAGRCEEPACVPQCEGKECGANGCGGTCGVCAGEETCGALGRCEAPACVRACAGRVCGDDGCGGSCGACAIGASCQAGACVAACVTTCAGKLCGDDGCGGSCGTCADGQACQGGACVSPCSCAGRACGDDGCGRICGYCIAGSVCNADTFQCDAIAVAESAADAWSPPQTEVVGARSCPVGQVWNAYASACVLDLNGGANAARSESGCASDDSRSTGPYALFALFGLLVSSALRGHPRTGPARFRAR